MIDLDELIEELRGVAKESTRGTQVIGSPIMRGGVLAGRTAEALESVRAERDDLEERLSGYLCDSTGGRLSKTGYDVRTMVTHTEEYYDEVHAEARKEIEADRDAALARIAEAAELHRPFEWSFGYGPVKSCRGCADRGVPQEKAEWPCPTAVALGLDKEE